MEPVAVPVAVPVGFERFYRSSYPGAVRLAWLLTHDASLCGRNRSPLSCRAARSTQ